MSAIDAQETEVVGSELFRAALRRFVTGVTVMTTRSPDALTAGVTVSSFNTLSLDPPLVLWSLALKAPSLNVFRASSRFAVNILAENQAEVAVRFATPASDKFHNIETTAGLGGAPLIAGAVAHLECLVEQRYPGGDHELIIGRIARVATTNRTPLVYGHGKFGNFFAAV